MGLSCPWCRPDGTCRNDDEATCSWKTIERTPEGLKRRMGEEIKFIKETMKQLGDDQNYEDPAVVDKIRDIKDRALGIKAMSEILHTDYNQAYSAAFDFGFYRDVNKINKFIKTLRKKSKEGVVDVGGGSNG